MRWEEEINELHDFFQAYFGDVESSLARVEAALAPNFTIVGPNGVESDRADTLAALAAGQGRALDLKITTTDHRMLLQSADSIMAGYVEHHESNDRSSRRCSTVVFLVDPDGPNGLRWLRVHETWMEVPT